MKGAYFAVVFLEAHFIAVGHPQPSINPTSRVVTSEVNTVLGPMSASAVPTCSAVRPSPSGTRGYILFSDLFLTLGLAGLGQLRLLFFGRPRANEWARQASSSSQLLYVDMVHSLEAEVVGIAPGKTVFLCKQVGQLHFIDLDWECSKV